MTVSLIDWLQRGPAGQQLISFNHHDILTGSLFTQQVARLCHTLQQHQARRWLLASEASDLFAIGLCAGLLAGKELVLPPNTQKGTLLTLNHSFDAVLADTDLQQGKDQLVLRKEAGLTDANWPVSSQFGSLTLYTSGSSGEPKAVTKSLKQLDAEVATLEHSFADHLPHCSVLATVSHQHIYGLLFKILWPLAASRPFMSEQIEYPETLSYYMALLPNPCLISSPAQLSRLPEALEFEAQQRRPSLIFSSGGPLGQDAAGAIARIYGQLPIEVYGSTETGGIAYRRQWTANEPWQPFPGIGVAQDKDQALLLTSPYLADDKALRCDDQISLLTDGRFVLEGRLDRVVKIEEKRLSLVQMEQLLARHPLVNQAALVVLDQPRTQLGAVVELSAEGQRVLAEEGKLALNNLLKTQLLSEFERVTLPRRWRYPKQMPLNSQGKRQLQTLLELFDHD